MSDRTDCTDCTDRTNGTEASSGFATLEPMQLALRDIERVQAVQAVRLMPSMPSTDDGLVFAAQATIRHLTQASVNWKTSGVSETQMATELQAYETAIVSLVSELQRRQPRGAGDQLAMRLATALLKATTVATKIGVERRSRQSRKFTVLPS